ncbi:HalOD1 output domain-containing protein [Halomicrococcus sp. NG-SE-24]|uniref:HalOD1 output domain-containing protein n=1 Tax=Halomicrococcus sp. NG-SE-24 TaxID=3436928 RepID=UPI003D98BC1F
MLTDGGSDRNQSTSSPSITYDIAPDEKPSEAVVRAVAALTDMSILDLDPVYEVIDPGHVDGIFTTDESRSQHVELSFEFNGCTVTVTHETVHAKIKL